MNRQKLKDQLVIDEGLRLKAYRDTVGKLTIGIGRNLDDRGITRDEAMVLLETDVALVEAELDGALPWWRKMTDARQNVLANMCFNLGLSKLLGFKNTLAAMQRGDYEAAARGMLDSLWAKQVGVRAARLASTMRTGAF